MTLRPRFALGPVPHRSSLEHRFDTFVGWTTRISPAASWWMLGLATAGLGLADAVTGEEAWLGPLYLLVICLATWTIGWRAGLLVGFASAGVSIAANGVIIYPLGSLASAWNLGMRILAIVIILILIGSVRRSYDQEWLRARSDALTGLLNKQAFLERAAIARRDGRWGILAYLDLDGLKQINDQHGHAAGDETLRSFAEGVKAIIRGTDAFARIGGDEFLLYVPVDGAAAGPALARQLHRRMNDIQGHRELPIRCSMGALLIAPGGPGISDGDIQLADRLMYEAKREGAALRTSARVFGIPDNLSAAGSESGPRLAA
jgi:diguanylate cyclase (GGDEF)-like protein